MPADPPGYNGASNERDSERDERDAGRLPASQVTHIGDVTFTGDFRPLEREFLAEQFSSCQFELVARSVQDPLLALVMWHGPAAGAGANPLYAAPRQAAYVLDTGHRDADRVSGRPSWRAAGPALIRVSGDADLTARFPGHFPGVRLRLPWWERVRHRWRWLLPGSMALAAAVWLASLWWALQR